MDRTQFELANLLEIEPDRMMSCVTPSGKRLNVAFELAKLEFDWRAGLLADEEICLIQQHLELALMALDDQDEHLKINIVENIVQIFSREDPPASQMH